MTININYFVFNELTTEVGVYELNQAKEATRLIKNLLVDNLDCIAQLKIEANKPTVNKLAIDSLQSTINRNRQAAKSVIKNTEENCRRFKGECEMFANATKEDKQELPCKKN